MRLFSSHQVRNRQSQIYPIVLTSPPTRRACATHPYAQYCCRSLCLSEPAVRVFHHHLPYQVPYFFRSLLGTNPGWGTCIITSLLAVLLLRIPVCVPTMPLLQPCSAQCANSRNRQHTMHIRQMRAALSVLQQYCLLLSSALIGLYMHIHTFCVVTGIFSPYRSSLGSLHSQPIGRTSSVYSSIRTKVLTK